MHIREAHSMQMWMYHESKWRSKEKEPVEWVRIEERRSENTEMKQKFQLPFGEIVDKNMRRS